MNLGLLETWIMLYAACYAVWSHFVLCSVVLLRLLQLCFTVKLQNCSIDHNTSPDFISPGGGEDSFSLLIELIL